MEHRSRYPTRTYPYTRAGAAALEAGGIAPVARLSLLPPGRLYRFLVGLDMPPGREMTESEREGLNDPFATLLLRRGTLPVTLVALLTSVDAFNGAAEGLPWQQAFVLAEGGQILWSPDTASLDRGFRWVIARGRPGSEELFVSTAPPFDSEGIFLQVLAWDPGAGAYQYYERRDGSWFWAGNSWDALRDPTRGQGPFDSHVNGSLVMKELKQPWLHWHSMAQTIPPEALAPDDALRTAPLFTDRSGGEQLESIVRRGIDRWTQARLDRLSTVDGRLQGVRPLLRQVLTTTTVNIASAEVPADGDEAEPIPLPVTFLLDADVLLDLLEFDVEARRPTVSRGRYRRACAALGQKLIDTRQGFERPGDVFFAWAVPEPAFEDINVLDHLLRREILSRPFVACLKMVDFSNPIGSRARERLMRYVPEEADMTGPRSVERLMSEAMEAALHGLSADAPERALLADLALAPVEREQAFTARITSFLADVQARLDTDDGLIAMLRLTDSRRRAFRRRPIAEFDMTLPWTDVPPDAPFLRLQRDTTVVPDA